MRVQDARCDPELARRDDDEHACRTARVVAADWGGDRGDTTTARCDDDVHLRYSRGAVASTRGEGRGVRTAVRMVVRIAVRIEAGTNDTTARWRPALVV